MGIRKNYGRNKKDKRPTEAIAAKRDETLRRAVRSKSAPARRRRP
jgi:hypothetical protein